jgi:transcription initiation factor TFIIB
MTYVSEKRNQYAPTSAETDDTCCLRPNIIQENGYFVCANCGVVHSRIMMAEPKLAFTYDEKKERLINERVYSPIGPRTIIKGYKDAKGNYLNPKYKSKFRRLAKINQNLINGHERNLWAALQTFSRLKFLLNIPDYVANDAFKIYNVATKKKMAMGRGIDLLLSVSIYSALKMHDIPTLIEDITKNINVSKNKFISCFKLVYRNVLPELDFKLSPFTPINYVDKFKEELHLSMKCRSLAINLINQCQKNRLIFAGKDPKGIAAASLYLSSQICEEPRTQKEICNFANITEVTLRARIKELKQSCTIF